MHLVFWQNIVSPHQLPYIKQLTKEPTIDTVTLVAAEDISEDRKRMGWENGSEIKNSVNLIIADKNRIPEEIAKELLSREQENSIHLFTGISSFEFCNYYLRMSLDYNVKRAIISEGPLTFSHGIEGLKPIWLHKIKYFLREKRYAPFINYIFAIGTPAVKYFSSINSKWKVFPFAYSTEKPNGNDLVADIEEKQGIVNYIFVGSLSKRKSPSTIVEAIKGLNNCNLTLVGDGEEKDKINRIIKNDQLFDRCEMIGFQKQSIIHEKMSQHDVLILPSLHDGWGAVVNEALQVGLYVLVSDRCGAADLIKDDEKRGMVFKAGNTKDLANKMRQVIANIQTIRANRIYRAKWAEQHISPEAIAHYMIECLTK